MSFSDGSDSVVRYRAFLPCRAWWKTICRARMVLPVPGSPAIRFTERSGSPPPRMRSNAAQPVDRYFNVDCMRLVRSLPWPDEPVGAQLRNLLQPADDQGSR